MTENMTQKYDSLLYIILRQNEYGYIIENSNLQVEERKEKNNYTFQQGEGDLCLTPTFQ
jgi:hypothetical protein